MGDCPSTVLLVACKLVHTSCVYVAQAALTPFVFTFPPVDVYSPEVKRRKLSYLQ
jgi:hypothetical protein